MTSEQMLSEVHLMLRMLTKEHRPHITFAEIRENLGFSKTAAWQWIKDHKIKRVGPGRYCRVSYTEAATRKAS